MEKIDFTKFQKEYKYLSDLDVKKLNDFFNKKNIFKLLKSESVNLKFTIIKDYSLSIFYFI